MKLNVQTFNFIFTHININNVSYLTFKIIKSSIISSKKF